MLKIRLQKLYSSNGLSFNFSTEKLIANGIAIETCNNSTINKFNQS